MFESQVASHIHTEVFFQGDSEYHEHFKWMNSPKSATFTPTKQQAAPTAGLSSPQTSLTRGLSLFGLGSSSHSLAFHF